VTKLTTDLLSIEEVLSTSLTENKTRYIFEGVSHLVSRLLLDSVVNIRKINKNGVKKMCRNIFTIQHTLTSNITGSRESSLDGAKTFYELLTLRQQVLSWTNIFCDKGTFNVSFYLLGHSKRDSGEGTRLHQGGLHSRPGAVAQERSQLELDHPEQAR
jgi:hypothetical protein